MPLTDDGQDYIAGAVIGAELPFDSTNAHIGIGDSTVAFSRTQTDLQAGVNKIRKGMATGYPVRVANTTTFKSTFGPGDGNFAWNEWAIFNSPTTGTMLSRLVESNGEKTFGQTWVFEVELVFELT